MSHSEWTMSDPFVYETLSGIIGAHVAVETVRGAVRGKLMEVLPDHIVVALGRNSFYIRTQQIIWVVPNPELVLE